MLIGWALIGPASGWRDLPRRSLRLFEAMISCLYPPVVACAVLFLLRYGGRRHRGIEAGHGRQCFLVPAAILLRLAQGVFSRSSRLVHACYVLEVAWRGGAFPARGLGIAPARVLGDGCGLAVVAHGRGRRGDGSARRAAACLRLHLMHFAMPVLLLRPGPAPGAAIRRGAAGGRGGTRTSRAARARADRRDRAQLRALGRAARRAGGRGGAQAHRRRPARRPRRQAADHRAHQQRRPHLHAGARGAGGNAAVGSRPHRQAGEDRRRAGGLARRDGVATVASRPSRWTGPARTRTTSAHLSARAYVQTTRILREATSNIIKHSGAIALRSIRCAIDDTDFNLVIQDNGRGIPMELDGKLDRGHGMASMKRRAKQLAGPVPGRIRPGLRHRDSPDAAACETPAAARDIAAWPLVIWPITADDGCAHARLPWTSYAHPPARRPARDPRNGSRPWSLQVFPASQISESARVHDARQQITAMRFDLALIDLGLPDGSGVDVVEALRESQPEAQSVVVTIHDDDDHLFPALAGRRVRLPAEGAVARAAGRAAASASARASRRCRLRSRGA